MSVRFLAPLISIAMLLSASPLWAHESHLKPMYGGLTADASVFQVELVMKGNQATLHVTEHGAPVETRNASGKLTVLSGKDKEEAVLTPNGFQSVGAKLKVQPAKGAKAVVVIDVPGKGTGNVRFTLK